MNIIDVIKIFDLPSYDEAVVQIQNENVLNATMLFLKKYNLENYTRLFLICFLIEKFPKDILGKFKDLDFEGIEIELTELDKTLHESSKNFVNYYKTNTNEYIDIEEKLNIFIEIFNNWKLHDKENLIETMKIQYDYLVINLFNAPEEIKSYLENCKQEILTISNKIKGKELVDEILNREKEIIKALETNQND